MKNKWTLMHYAILLVVIAFAYFSLNVVVRTWEGFTWWFIDFSKVEAGNFATFIAGIFSFISTLLLIYTIFVQINQNNVQNLQYTINQFENKFFKLVDYHSDNIKEFDHIRPDKEGQEISEGRIVFKRMLEQFFIAYKILDNYLNSDSINSIYKDSETRNNYKSYINNIIELNNDLDKEHSNELHLVFLKINIAYLALFYGTPEKDKSIDILVGVLSKTYNMEEFSGILEGLRTKKTSYYPHQKFFGGHQSRLGHYFRNLYRSVKYVESRNFLMEEQKKEYIKILRAQLSNYEQAIIFINSLSILGKSWEREYFLHNNEGLITKYEIIKNIPQNLFSIVNIKPEYFYPLIQFEYED